MATILCTGVESALLETRRLILENEGHRVVSVTDEVGLLAACEKHSFDVAVIGQAVTPNMKRRFSRLIRQCCPDVKVLELYPPYDGRIVADADSWLVVPTDAPEGLARAVVALVPIKDSRGR